ncbi:lytic transglycosylase domain-containing protein [Burkholderia multivorans]|uniref:pesticin C-terminus-like muramidase n=1 Tax=Burkholderia multivorans TaxID=87883 RepID=UPI000CFF04C8|nr:pesticin C-terminus-like muramidase [Burkholderia multivorans]AYY97214.1 lytic transglycosylase domain-containing protein [Burkholderia multivorans]MBU9121204.1 lytic transglycosylase domain-containing protein [Burkholderia multivorans]PRF47908.1 calcium-binding protein [Burkholderia multivorans]PRG49610.1 calcium-binding protein [Burkholderia multivorans]
MSKTDPKKKHHPPAAPKPAQKPAEPADTPLNWAYPFTPVGKADATDPMTYFKALAKSENGFYPLGASGMWHGGVHFSHGSAEMLNQDSGVRAIADGKIVAYRLNTKYEETTYPDKTLAHYSTGFVLVRHELKLPPKPAPNQPSQPASAPAPASGTATPPTPAPPDSTPANSKPASDKPLVFFSLYMHTMDWETYRKAIEQAKSNSRPDPLLPVPMSYWEGERYYRVGGKAKDKQSLPKPKAPAQPAGASNDPFGNPALPDYHLDDLPSVDPEPGLPPPPPETGLNIRDLPKGKVIGVLPKGAEVIAGEGDPAHPNWIKIKAVKSGTILPAVVGQPVSPQAPWGYLFKAELDAVVDPKPLDSVVILKEPHPVKAGEVIAHVGQYQWATKAGPLPPQANYPMLHLEVFAGPDLKDFIDRSRNRAKELNDKNKPLLEIMPGAKLVSEIPAPDQQLTQAGLKLVPIGDAKGARWVKVQPKSVTTQPAKGNKKATQTLTDVGKPLWVESRLANTVSTGNVSGWQNFPLDGAKATGPGADFRDVYRRADLDKLGAENIAIDDKGRHWWNITIGSKDGSARQGWVCETGNPLVQFRSPWEWPGFELVDNGSVSPADMFKRHIHTTEQYLPGEEGTEFAMEAVKVNAGELITKIEQAIDTDHDGKVTAQELKHALETQWMAEAVSHLVVRNETEWGGGLSKWEELTPLMQKQTELWKTELDRLAKLQWWDQIKGVDGFPTDLSPWHLHPIGLIGNFTGCSAKCKTNVLDFLTTEGMFYASVEGFHLILDSEGFGEIPYVPKNSQSSGVTIGYGYDLGQQTEAMVRSDFDGFFTEDEITRLLTALGKRGDEARKFIPSLTDIKISEPKALEMAKRVKKRYAQFTVDAFPGTAKLHPHCQGALLSLVYNRGAQLEDKPGQKSRAHMRNIRAAIENKNLPEVAVQLRAMKVLWEGTGNDGLLKRREKEAVLFEKGMTCDCWR